MKEYRVVDGRGPGNEVESMSGDSCRVYQIWGRDPHIRSGTGPYEERLRSFTMWFRFSER